MEKTKNGIREGQTPKLATCPFSDVGNAAGIQSNLQSFRALVSGLLASKQRLSVRRLDVDKKTPRKKSRILIRCAYLFVSRLWGILSYGREFAESKLADRGRDGVTRTKGGVLWKINVIIEERRVGERDR